MGQQLCRLTNETYKDAIESIEEVHVHGWCAGIYTLVAYIF